MTPTTKAVIYYFSGTGNSQNVARWVSNVAEHMGIECNLVNIADRVDELTTPPQDALLFFISPVHGFNYPPIMVYFLANFPRGNNRIVLMNTRGGLKLGKFVTPGLSGITFYLAGLILKLKGYKISGMFPVDLPSNWISLHPGLNKNAVKYLHIKNHKRVTQFADKILSGEKEFKALREIIQDILISPIAVLYFVLGRFFLAKTMYASSDCDNCRLCIKSCPVKAIKLVNERPFWTIHCESCMKCVGQCPKKAIEVGHGYIFLFVFVVGLFTHLIPFENPILDFVAENALLLLLLIIVYRFIHFILKFRFLEKMLVYTSLTKYKFWGRRYKALKDKEFLDSK